MSKSRDILNFIKERALSFLLPNDDNGASDSDIDNIGKDTESDLDDITIDIDIDIDADADVEVEYDPDIESEPSPLKHDQHVAYYRIGNNKKVGRVDSNAASSTSSNDSRRSLSWFNTSAKRDNPLELNSSALMALSYILMTFLAIDFLAVALLSSTRFFSWAESLMYALHLDTLVYRSHTLVQVQVILTFIISFLVGSVLVYALMRCTEKLSELASLQVTRKKVVYILLGFIAIVLILMVISMISGNNYYSYSTFRSLAPLPAYLGGLILYGLSAIRVEIYS